MKKNLTGILLALLIMLLTCSGCGEKGTTVKIVKIAVMGNPTDFYPAYKEGIERALADLNQEYRDRGYRVEGEFYSDNGSYAEGMAIADRLARDASVTAVIAPIDMDTSKTAAYAFNRAEKLFVVPYFLYDSVYADNHYDMVFSLCNSGDNIGRILRSAAARSAAQRWVVCADGREFEMSEVHGFMQSSADGISVIDCVNISALRNNFAEVYKRWDTLGVEGVVMFPQDTEGFELLKKLKQKNPRLVFAGDTAFDESDMLTADAELMSAIVDFIMAHEFRFAIQTEDERQQISIFADDYRQKTGRALDSWYIQGYNAVRMIGDTAIRNNTTKPQEIAKLLHEKGYKGFGQTFDFAPSGALHGNDDCYSVYLTEGKGKTVQL